MDNKQNQKIQFEISRNTFFILTLIIIAVAGFLRFWQIQSIRGIFPDNAISGMEAIYSPVSSFYYRFGEHDEGLFILLLKGIFQLAGAGVWQIYGTTALIGTMTVAGTIWAVRKFESRFVSLMTGLFLATSVWHNALSRSGFRAILTPLLLTLLIGTGISWIKTGGKKYAVFTGLLFALGFYTYPVFRMTLLELALILAVAKMLQIFKNFRLNNLKLFMLAFLLALIPLVTQFIITPQPLLSRLNEVSVFTGRSIPAGLILAIKQTGQTLIGFIIRGDLNFRHNYFAQPLITPGVSLFFLVGLGVLINDLISKKNNIRSLLYLGTFTVFLLPAVLAFEKYSPPPHGLRLVGEIPLVFLISTLGAEKVILLIIQKFKLNDNLLGVIIGAGAALLVYYNVAVVNNLNMSLDFARHYRQDLPVLADYMSKPEFNDVLYEKDVYVVATEFERFSLDFFLRNHPVLGTDQMTIPLPQDKKKIYSPIKSKTKTFETANVNGTILNKNTLILLPVFSESFNGINDNLPLGIDDKILSALLDRYPEIKLQEKVMEKDSGKFPGNIIFYVLSYDVTIGI